MSGAWVYRCRSVSGQALYIGMTDNLNRRISQHRDKFWWADVLFVETTWCDERDAAAEMEREEITRHQPPYNKTGVKVDQRQDRRDVWHTPAREAARKSKTVSEQSGRRLATLAEAAAHINVHPRTVRRAIAAGTLAGYRIGTRAIRVDLDEVEALVRPMTTVRSFQ